MRTACFLLRSSRFSPLDLALSWVVRYYAAWGYVRCQIEGGSGRAITRFGTMPRTLRVLYFSFGLARILTTETVQ